METLREIYFEQTEYIHSTFDVERSMFDKFLIRSNWPLFRPAAVLKSVFCFRLPHSHFPIPNRQPAFISFTAQTLYSGMPEMGSSAALVRRLAAAKA